MTPEQLLIPRYKFTNPYPGSKFKVGDILMRIPNSTMDWYTTEDDFIWCDKMLLKSDIDKYPHLFQPLPWYAERKIEDMPEYLKMPSGQGHVRKVDCYNFNNSKVIFEGGRERNTKQFIPATLEEYGTFKKSQL